MNFETSSANFGRSKYLEVETRLKYEETYLNLKFTYHSFLRNANIRYQICLHIFSTVDLKCNVLGGRSSGIVC